MTQLNCATCGAALPDRFKTARMISCDYCGTTNAVMTDGLRALGSAGDMDDTPSLFQLDQLVDVAGRLLLPVGHARFDYGRGWWDEYWCLEGDAGLWLSVDEGDIVVETPLPVTLWPVDEPKRLGQMIAIPREGPVYTVTEIEAASCTAVRGAFPEVLDLGEPHRYVDLTGPNGWAATYEEWDSGAAWFTGQWVDPWKVRAQ